VKDMALKRCIRTETLWNKKEASRGSPEMTDMRLVRSDKKDRLSSLIGPRNYYYYYFFFIITIRYFFTIIIIIL